MKETRRINMKQKEIDQDIVIKMFDHLKGRVHVANQNGPYNFCLTPARKETNVPLHQKS